MLAYFDTSGHDDQTLREIHNRRPTPEFLDWCLQRDIFTRAADGGIVRGSRWGDSRQFCDSEEEFQELLGATPATYGLATAGPRPANAVTRQVRINQSISREAIHTELNFDELRAIAPFRIIETQARSKEEHLSFPDRGSRLSEESLAGLAPEKSPVQILVSDGLSAAAVHANLNDLLPVILEGCAGRGIRTGQPILARYGRVKLAEPLSEHIQADLIVYLIGERPGGDVQSSQSLSAYLVYRLNDVETQTAAARFSGSPAVRFETTVISNIYGAGLPPAEAGAVVVEKIGDILEKKAAGNRLESLLRNHPVQ